MATKLKEVDVVIVGLGWTGGILAKELAEAGLKVVALERGAMRIDRQGLCGAQHPRRVALRRAPRPHAEHRARHAHGAQQSRRRKRCRCGGSARSCPARSSAARACTGAATPGAGPTWSSRSARLYEERYGKSFIPADMTIQDWGITYAELEPYYDKFEYTAAVSGKAGNIKGQIQRGGNPFEAPRARDYPLPPLTPILASEMFTKAAENNGYHPFPRPSANASQRLYQSRRIEIRRRASIAATASASAARPTPRAARTSR